MTRPRPVPPSSSGAMWLPSSSRWIPRAAPPEFPHRRLLRRRLFRCFASPPRLSGAALHRDGHRRRLSEAPRRQGVSSHRQGAATRPSRSSAKSATSIRMSIASSWLSKSRLCCSTIWPRSTSGSHSSRCTRPSAISPQTSKQPFNLQLEYRDANVIDFGNKIDLGDLNFRRPTSTTATRSSCRPRATSASRCSPSASDKADKPDYFGFAETLFAGEFVRTGEPVQFFVRQDADRGAALLPQGPRIPGNCRVFICNPIRPRSTTR